MANEDKKKLIGNIVNQNKEHSTSQLITKASEHTDVYY